MGRVSTAHKIHQRDLLNFSMSVGGRDRSESPQDSAQFRLSEIRVKELSNLGREV